MSCRIHFRSLNHLISGFSALKYPKHLNFVSRRPFATSHSDSAHSFGYPVSESRIFKQYVDSSVESYKSNRDVVDSEMTNLLNSHSLLLFMEGSVDNPKSLCAANIVKMFTLLQVLNFHTVDVLSNKEVFGFLCSKLGEPARNVLFKNGAPFAGHDELLELFKRGKLLEALGVPKSKPKPTHKEFKDHLPVASF